MCASPGSKTAQLLEALHRIPGTVRTSPAFQHPCNAWCALLLCPCAYLLPVLSLSLIVVAMFPTEPAPRVRYCKRHELR